MAKAKAYSDIRPGDRVTIVIPNGLDMNRNIEWKYATGRAVFKSSVGNWVLNMGGPHGTPAVASLVNFVTFRKAPKRTK